MSKTDIIKARWATALHEAGHVTVGQSRGGSLLRPSAQAAVFPDCSGCASVSGMTTKPYLTFKYAVYAASGLASEELAEIYEPPRRKLHPPTPKEIINETRISEIISTQITENLSTNLKNLRPDPLVIIDYCTQFDMSSPDDWKHRYERVTITAQEQVQLYREEIHAIAVKLFIDGAWFDPGEKDPHAVNTNFMPVE